MASRILRRPVKKCAQCGADFEKAPAYSMKYWERAKYCSSTCSGAAQSERAATVRPSLAEAFWPKVEKGPDCWEWRGQRDRDGYGVFFIGKRGYRANVASLLVHGVKRPSGAMACHRCDNPGCVNPAHLYFGTAKNNAEDAASRNRIPKGSSRPNAVLSEDAVRAIRTKRKTQREYAADFGVSRATISDVQTGRKWGHVQ